MLRARVHTDREDLWRDAARRMRRMALETADCAAAVFDGATLARPGAVERELAAGRHVLIAAEPCLVRGELEFLVGAARRQGVLLSVVNPDRYLASRDVIRRQIGGPLGSPELVRIHRWQAHASAETMSPLGLPGLLVGEIEQALWLVDQPVRTVFALRHLDTASTTQRGGFWQAHLSFAAGMALVDYDDRLPEGNCYRSVSVIGSRGSAQWDDQGNGQLQYGQAGPQAAVVEEGVRYLATMIDDFAAAVNERRDTSAEIAAWIVVAQVIAALQHSLAVRETVHPETC